MRAFLLAQVPGVRVATKVPADRPVRFIRAWRNGGSASSRVQDNPTVTVDCWAASDVDALELASRCRDAFLNNYTAMPLVRGVEETGSFYSVPDPESGSSRYRFSVRLRVRAAFK